MKKGISLCGKNAELVFQASFPYPALDISNIYQFDEKLYHSKHFKKGYFDDKRDGFGPVVENENDLLCILRDYIKRYNVLKYKC